MSLELSRYKAVGHKETKSPDGRKIHTVWVSGTIPEYELQQRGVGKNFQHITSEVTHEPETEITFTDWVPPWIVMSGFVQSEN